MAQSLETINVEKTKYDEVNTFNQLREERVMKIQSREEVFEKEMQKDLEKCIAKNGSQEDIAEIRRNAYNDSGNGLYAKFLIMANNLFGKYSK
jgi:hypothetical protein